MTVKNKKNKIVSLFLVCFCIGVSLLSANDLNVDNTLVNPEVDYFDNIAGSQTTGSELLNMNYYSSNSFIESPISIVKGNVYNITLNSTGSAIFDVSLVFDAVSTDYVSQTSTTVMKDEFLTTCGAPLWGSYNVWDSFTLNSLSYKGISLSVATPKSFLIYLDSKFEGESFNCTFLIILRSTLDTTKNYISIDWTTIDFSNPDLDIDYTDDTALYAEALLPSSFKTINFNTTENRDLTESMLNETITVDSNLYLIKWIRDLSGNVVRKTELLSGIKNTVYCPKVLNQIINGSDGLVGVALNINPSVTATLTWGFTEITDTTVNYSELNITGTDEENRIRFRPGYYNQAWRILEIDNDTQYFDIEFVDKSGFNQLYWDVQIQFYLIGNTTTPFLLNSYGDNKSEKIRIFRTSQNNDFKSSVETFIKKSFGTYQYWLSRIGVLTPNPSTSTYTGTKYLGIVITAIPSIFLLDFNCTVDFTIHEIKDLVSDDEIYMGYNNGLPYDEFDAFHVRKFDFMNYDQYKWGVKAENASVLNTVSDLRCNNPDDSYRYPKNLNNALISIPINSMTLSGSIYLRYSISTTLQPNDYLYVYVKNSTAQTLIYTYSMLNATNTPNFRITRHSDTNLQIIFNMSTDAIQMGDVGPIIDNVEIHNGTHKAFYDTFEYAFDKWTQVDNTGSNLKYWRIQRSGVTYNSPVLKIIYPNTIYTLAGNNADPFSYHDLYKQFMNFNPYIQTNDINGATGYIVILPNSNLVQNFTVQITQEKYSVASISNGLVITANYNYNQIVFLDGYNQYQVVELDEVYRYYSLSLDPNFRYDITFSIEGNPLIAVYSSILSEEGINWAKNMKDYYGFFMINHTYTIRPSISELIYLKINPIDYGTSITVNVVKTPVWTEFPWTSLIIGILAALNVLSLVWLIKTKKDQNDKEKPSDKTDRNTEILSDKKTTTDNPDSFKF